MAYDNLRGFSSHYTGIVRVLYIAVSLIKPDTGEESKVCRGIIDTGATNCVISGSFAADFGLIPVGKKKTLGVGGEHMANQYYVKLKLPDNYITDTLLITDGALEQQGIDFIVGMDVINQGDFAVTKKDNRTFISFITPPQETIDFVSKYREKKFLADKIELEEKRRIGLDNKIKKRNKKRKR